MAVWSERLYKQIAVFWGKDNVPGLKMPRALLTGKLLATMAADLPVPFSGAPWHCHRRKGTVRVPGCAPCAQHGERHRGKRHRGEQHHSELHPTAAALPAVPALSRLSSPLSWVPTASSFILFHLRR